MRKKLLIYAPPQTCAEPLIPDGQLCQASPASFDEPTDLDGLVWSD